MRGKETLKKIIAEGCRLLVGAVFVFSGVSDQCLAAMVTLPVPYGATAWCRSVPRANG